VRVPDIPFVEFDKIARLKRDIVITEKIDGTNAQVYISDEGEIHAGSRTRWITPGKLTDNYGFAGWVEANADELKKLGPGHHFGEWWGQGVQRNYGVPNKRFSLFNSGRWAAANLPDIPNINVVPVLYTGPFDTEVVDNILQNLKINGSVAAPGFMNPEGIVVYLTQARTMYKVTLDHNDQHKWSVTN